MSARADEPPTIDVAAAVILHAGRVLVQTRPAGRRYAGWWEFPGGKLEPGEDAAGCARRECREELGLDVAVRAVLHVVAWRYPGASVRVTFLLCAVEPGAGEPRATEGQRLLWADADALDRLRFLPANAEVFALLRPLLG